MTNRFSAVGRRALLASSISFLGLAAVPRLALAASAPENRYGPRITPEMFGAKGDGRDDTAGLRAMVDAVNRAGRGHVVFAPGKTYFLGHKDQKTLHFQNVDGLLIEGNGATLKTAIRGCPTASLGYNWGQINVENCLDVQIMGLVFDGNRVNQTHTVGQRDGVGFNAGVSFWTASDVHSTRDVLIRSCTFMDHGTLTASSDVRGDGIFARSGIHRMSIEDCLFERVGRWAFALAEGATPSEHNHFRRNRVQNENRVEARNRPWGAVDIEDHGLPNKHIYIEDNQFFGTSQIAYSGFGAGRGEVVCQDTFIRRNLWDIPAGHAATNVPFALGFSLPGSGTYREMRRLFIEDNHVRWRGAAQTTHIGHSAKLHDLFLRRNTFIAEDASATSEGGIVLAYGGHMEGLIEIRDNRLVGLGEAFANSTWFSDPSPEPLHLVVGGNEFERCYRAFNLQFDGSAAPASSSSIVVRGNVSRNTRAPNGEYLHGGRLSLNLYDRHHHDKIWDHVNVSYR